LERLLQAGERTGSVIEILVLQALAHEMQGTIPAALAALSRALSLAEPEAYVHKRADIGPLKSHLLDAAAKWGIAPHSVRQLLATFALRELPQDSESGWLYVD
jgi:LuxR family transcriptional regulator, maltose regulon positive regulatory protein